MKEAEQRERARGNRTIGEAREHFGTHDHCSYNFTVATTQPVSVVAAQVAQAWHTRLSQPR